MGNLICRCLPQPKDAQSCWKEGLLKAPATPIEEKLLTMVQELLENDAVSAEDSFFLAGGHSLLGMQLVMRLRKTFGVDLTLRQLFEAPTVERLASVVEIALKEKRLAVIWANMLGRKDVGLDDNLFDTGDDPALVAALQERSYHRNSANQSTTEQLQSPTVRQQVAARGEKDKKWARAATRGSCLAAEWNSQQHFLVALS